jgi:AGZA family xanthine/uracil permease-like MFS transporter
MGLLPGVAAWGALMVKAGVRAAGGTFGPELGVKLTQGDTFAMGLFSLEQGFIFTAMVWSAATVAIIEGQFRRAAGWMILAAVAAWFGIIHGWAWTPADTVLAVGWGVGAASAGGYLVAAALFALAPLLGTREAGPGHGA